MLLILILIFFPFSYSALDAMLINSHLWNLCDSYCSFDVDYQPMGQTPFFAAWRTPVAEMFIITMYCNNHDVLLKYRTDCIYAEVIDSFSRAQLENILFCSKQVRQWFHKDSAAR